MSFLEGLFEFGSGLLESLGSGISNLVQGFKSVIEQIPISLELVLKVACTIIHEICKALGITSEDTPEELGAKAQQADKQLEDFSDTEEYIKYLNEQVELDREAFDKMSPEEKNQCKIIGLSIETKAAEDKMEVKLPPEYVTTMAKLKETGKVDFSAEDWIELTKNLKDAGIINLNDVVDFLEGKSSDNYIETGAALKESVEKMESVESAGDCVENMKQAVRNFEEEQR